MTTPPMPPAPPPNRPVACSLLSGFFVLRRCGRPAAGACPSCGRPVCPEHFGSDGLCPECSRQVADSAYHRSWTYGYRRTHYENTPTVYGSSTWYPSFDQNDRDAFEPGGGDWAAASGDFAGGSEWDGSDGDAGGDWDSDGDGLVDS
ncbi:hypothetical protein [Actinomadura oligospora]|uniref:hypothetical protein n=1 Tax=Actinomadura oligospora TaxID=111804 RepID=UPI0004B7029F|nr:hypothetical protein [Actinomadura oligospora]